ncbi:MAG: glycerol-3-phosphate dehydrogenase/oxidase [Actinomycetota bacterium]|nr:glycerol-3-phosphate dehydrogenase/oxidase [Actinomycetota bacterium]
MRSIQVGGDGLPDHTDVLVVGLGVTGAGVALDAASRGLDVVAVDAFDLAWGTSRWSSKLVHGGLRYLANLQFHVAHESAVERGILMETTAPHLTRALPMLIPLTPAVSRSAAMTSRVAVAMGDLLRIAAGTSPHTLPRPRTIPAAQTLALAPGVRREGLRGSILSFDGQLEDDARLVVAIARTAAAQGARLHTRSRVVELSGTHAVIRDELTGSERRIEARAVVNAAGVWAAQLVDEIRLKPSRGTHLVLKGSTLPGLRVAVMAPVPEAKTRFVFALPQPDGNIYVGLTDEEVDGDILDVPEPTDAEIDFLLEAIGSAFERRLARADVVGAYAGLRPLLDAGGATADLSRRHAVLTSRTGVVTIVGGKLTTYRRMAQDAVDAVVAQRGLAADRCRTTTLPLIGAASRRELARIDGPSRLVRRYGTEAPAVLENARRMTGLTDQELLAPVAPGVPTTMAELVFGVTHEGARTVEDLLERRTRIAMVPTDAALARPTAERVLEMLANRRP